MGVQQHTMIIYIRISSEVTNTSTLPLNQEGILSLPQSSTHLVKSSSQSHHHRVIELSSQLLPSSSSYRSSNGTICHRKFLQSQPFFMLGVGLVLIQVFITYSSNPYRRDCPGPSLHFHNNNLHCLPLSCRIQIISFVLHKTKQSIQSIHGQPAFYRQRRTTQLHLTCFMT